MDSVSNRRGNDARFLPALPTLWPRMLWSRSREGSFFPFNVPSAQYFYFARNAVWRAAKMLGVQDGEVLAPAYHHGVEIEALVDAGASVRFYRVGAHWDVDLADVEKKISKRTRALYLTHFAGFPGPAAEMKRMAQEHGLVLIEDCALSLLSADGDRPLGKTGEVSIFCLYKMLPVPNGGALIINGACRYSEPSPVSPPWSSTASHAASALLQNLELRADAPGRWIRAAARRLGRRTVEAASIERIATGTQHFNRAHVDLGISPLSMRIAGAQDFPSIVEARRRNFFFLLERLREVSAPLINQLPPGVCPLFYPLVVADKDDMMAHLKRRGIEAVNFWRDFHPQCDPASFPDVARLRRMILEIPCHQDLNPAAMGRIASAVREALLEQNPLSSSRARW